VSYHTYVDWTQEDPPRPFYVGKGNQRRVDDTSPRNAIHKRIAAKYGFRREVVLSTEVEQEAFEREVHLIEEYRTFAHGGAGWWGANLTLGGDGASGYRHTEKHKQHISDALRGREFSVQHRQNLSKAHTGRKHTEETKRKCRDAVKRRKSESHPPGCVCGKHSTGLKRRLVTPEGVRDAREWYNAGAAWAQVATRLGVSNSTLQRALKRYDEKGLDSTEKSLQSSAGGLVVGGA